MNLAPKRKPRRLGRAIFQNPRPDERRP